MRPYNHDTEEGWKRILHQRVANHVEIYAGAQLLATNLLVAHRNIISVFCLESSRWTQNIKFDDYVTTLTSTKLFQKNDSEDKGQNQSI